MNKKVLLSLLLIFISFFLFSCKKKTVIEDKGLKLLKQEAKLSYDFFMETTNFKEDSAGYGMARDRWPDNQNMSSIASTGYMLAALPYGVENGFIERDVAFERASKTLDTLIGMETHGGFFFHWVHMETSLPLSGSEVSIIDTALLLAGAIVAAEYFGAEVKEKMQIIYDRIDWNFYVNKERNMFYMGYKPNAGGFSGAWDHMSEQLIMYVLAAGSSTHPTDDSLYRTIKNIVMSDYRGKYKSKNHETKTYIYGHNGSLFQHQFSHAYIDFRNIVDYQGTNWYENAIEATLANYYFCKDNQNMFIAYQEAWGLSACDHPFGYKAFGAEVAKKRAHNGTIAPYAAIASVNYTPDKTFEAIKFFDTLDELKGKYGYKDAYNLGPVDPLFNQQLAEATPWYDNDYLGIDKGITLLMIANYESELIWNLFMKNDNVKRGLEVLNFSQS
ncbi:MAG: glucoamylase family protein [Acholeplasmatales bacterium]